MPCRGRIVFYKAFIFTVSLLCLSKLFIHINFKRNTYEKKPIKINRKIFSRENQLHRYALYGYYCYIVTEPEGRQHVPIAL